MLFSAPQMRYMKSEMVDAELERDGKIQHVKVYADVKVLTVESATIVTHVIEKRRGFAGALQLVEDGAYTLTCILDGKRQPGEQVRVQGGRLL